MTAQRNEPIENPGLYFNIVLNELLYGEELSHLNSYQKGFQLFIALVRYTQTAIIVEDGVEEETEIEL